MQEIVEMEGHLIDSDILKNAWNRIVELGGEFEVLSFKVGNTNDEPSKVKLLVKSGSQEALDEIMLSLQNMGAAVDLKDCCFEKADADRTLPENFYSSTNLETSIRIGRKWVPVEKQKMDCAIAWDGSHAECRKMALVKKGNQIVVGSSGIRVKPLERSRDYSVFDFMSGDVSAELNKGLLVKSIADEIKSVKKSGRKVAFVTGPAVIHSGADSALQKIIEAGYIDVLLTGNAFAVHDIEKAIFGTSLGVSRITGKSVSGGHKHHLRAINRINRSGGIKAAVEQGVLVSGIMHACVKNSVKFVLAGSIRDDGPLSDVITDTKEAQKAYIEALKDVDIVVILASTLHGIAVGNLLEARVKLVCVDISEATPLKLSDRGSKQSIGIVTDVCYFTEKLAQNLA